MANKVTPNMRRNADPTKDALTKILKSSVLFSRTVATSGIITMKGRSMTIQQRLTKDGTKNL